MSYFKTKSIKGPHRKLITKGMTHPKVRKGMPTIDTCLGLMRDKTMLISMRRSKMIWRFQGREKLFIR